MKTCNTCKQAKPLSEYWKNSYSLDGHAHKCIECGKAYKRSEEYKAKRRATRDLVKNREDCKKYAAKNKEKIAARQKIYYAQPEVKERMKAKRRAEYLKKGKQRGLDGIDNLSDNYIKNIITSRAEGLTYADIPQAMVDVKRLQILIRREVLENTTAEERRAAARAKTKAKNPTKSKEYYLNNKEKAKAASKAWRDKNIEKVRARERERRALNREKINAQARARYDPEKQKVKGALYREAHREELIAKSRAKYAENKEAINAKRRNITPEQRAHINALARAAVARRKLTNQQGVTL